MTRQENYTAIIVDFLKSHTLISKRQLEIELVLPAKTLSLAIMGRRLIPEKHVFDIVCFLANYGLKIDGYTLDCFPDSQSILAWKWDGAAQKMGKWIAWEYKDLPTPTGNF